MLRRGSFAFPDARRYLFKGLVLLQRRQSSVLVLFFFCLILFQAHAVKAFHLLPSGLQYGLSLCRKEIAFTVQHSRYRFKPVCLGCCAKKPCSNQRQYITLPGRKLRQICPGNLHRRNDSVMVGNFAAIGHAVNIRLPGASFPKGHMIPQPEDQ